MTHTPEAIRAAELANAESVAGQVVEPYQYGPNGVAERRAFARYIRTVSDAVEAVSDYLDSIGHEVAVLTQQEALAKFILPKPVDPLVKVMMCLVPGIPQPNPGESYADAMARKTYAALDAAGFEIVRKGDLPTPGEK